METLQDLINAQIEKGVLFEEDNTTAVDILKNNIDKLDWPTCQEFHIDLLEAAGVKVWTDGLSFVYLIDGVEHYESGL